ncbi:Cys-tRNA(Pro)/Cys-tRNA(Cys) deacylase ybaK [Corynebacterium humireducens NBRC 106098 = DSM 45392]|uniref:Cys-tRNA(Pro)/Cys-tRNA(Cys) deacylase n=1 Tax=Corynebacterium humireducens NBRC 106098 = DSM 45392 TaxID=1223515 RepID=A0A0B5D883_9CORY|nr:Cys-tRNA(Pro) deacylase [Corynebacterium humireducens]AJE32428.1 Cys-tRNA(Pro)/Cys-tRNA(Cys) deacylase ybaK [Corynebacterium humireducens NBRC 106098 = DSM 45392]
MARRPSAPTAAVRVLLDAAVPHLLHTFEAGTDDFGEQAAAALDVDPHLILKTLVVDTGRELAVCCVPVTGRLSLKKAAAALGVKSLDLADPAKAQRATGYVTGGISPLGQKRRLRTVIDASVEKQPQVYVSGGRRGLDIALDPQDLARLTGAQFSAISSG